MAPETVCPLFNGLWSYGRLQNSARGEGWFLIVWKYVNQTLLAPHSEIPPPITRTRTVHWNGVTQLKNLVINNKNKDHEAVIEKLLSVPKHDSVPRQLFETHPLQCQRLFFHWSLLFNAKFEYVLTPWKTLNDFIEESYRNKTIKNVPGLFS